MNYQERNEQNTAYLKFRATMHLAMGVVYLFLGGFVIFYQAFGAFFLKPPWPYILGGLMLVYGAFRIWRGLADMRIRRRTRKP